MVTAQLMTVGWPSGRRCGAVFCGGSLRSLRKAPLQSLRGEGRPRGRPLPLPAAHQRCAGVRTDRRRCPLRWPAPLAPKRRRRRRRSPPAVARRQRRSHRPPPLAQRCPPRSRRPPQRRAFGGTGPLAALAEVFAPLASLRGWTAAACRRPADGSLIFSCAVQRPGVRRHFSRISVERASLFSRRSSSARFTCSVRGPLAACAGHSRPHSLPTDRPIARSLACCCWWQLSVCDYFRCCALSP